MKPRQWKFYKSTVLLYFEWSGWSLFDVIMYTPTSEYSQLLILCILEL